MYLSEKKINSIYCTLLAFVLLSCQTATENKVAPLPEDHVQKTLIAQLSGKMPLYDNTILTDRWTPESRKRTRIYLTQIIKHLGISPIAHTYQFANTNFGIDLILNPFKGTNIYGILPATIKTDEYIILGAHYDTGKRNAPGAIDNATGVTLIYSTIKEIQKLDHRSKNVLFVFFDQEEEENIGSKAFIELIKKKTWKIHSVHCFDMIGWDKDGDQMLEFYSVSKPILDLYENIAKIKNINLYTTYINSKDFNRSATDFDEFAKAGYPSIGGGDCFYKNDISKYKDSQKDTYETVNFSYLKLGTNFITHIITLLINN